MCVEMKTIMLSLFVCCALFNQILTMTTYKPSHIENLEKDIIKKMQSIDDDTKRVPTDNKHDTSSKIEDLEKDIINKMQSVEDEEIMQTDDMIAFRPLFAYRQEENRKRLQESRRLHRSRVTHQTGKRYPYWCFY